MGRRYSVEGTRTVDATDKTLLTVVSATTIRPALYDVFFGSNAAPSDVAYRWLLERFTAAGTAGGAVTPAALDPGDPASLASSGEAHTTDPTYSGSILFNVGANKRSTQRWVASPGGELICPATAANGIGLQCIHSSDTGQIEGTIHYEE